MITYAESTTTGGHTDGDGDEEHDSTGVLYLDCSGSKIHEDDKDKEAIDDVLHEKELGIGG